jgi:hypothetical protein
MDEIYDYRPRTPAFTNNYGYLINIQSYWSINIDIELFGQTTCRTVTMARQQSMILIYNISGVLANCTIDPIAIVIGENPRYCSLTTVNADNYGFWLVTIVFANIHSYWSEIHSY